MRESHLSELGNRDIVVPPVDEDRLAKQRKAANKIGLDVARPDPVRQRQQLEAALGPKEAAPTGQAEGVVVDNAYADEGAAFEKQKREQAQAEAVEKAGLVVKAEAGEKRKESQRLAAEKLKLAEEKAVAEAAAKIEAIKAILDKPTEGRYNVALMREAFALVKAKKSLDGVDPQLLVDIADVLEDYINSKKSAVGKVKPKNFNIEKFKVAHEMLTGEKFAAAPEAPPELNPKVGLAEIKPASNVDARKAAPEDNRPVMRRSRPNIEGASAQKAG